MSKGKTAIKAAKPIISIGGKVIKGVKRNSDWIMMILAWLGLAGSTALAVKATISAVKLCETKEIHGKKEVIRTVWRLYIPAVGCFIVTTLSIGGLGFKSIRLAKKLATTTGLLAMTQTDLKDLKAKAAEVIGEKKEQEKIEDGIAKDKLNAMTIPPEEQIIKTGHGNKLFLEWLTGQIIRTSPEWVAAVSENMNNQFSKEVDGVVEVAYYLDQFKIPTDCWVGRAIWDYAEMLQRGDKEFKIDCHELQWMEINGQQEMVGIIRPPEPTGA